MAIAKNVFSSFSLGGQIQKDGEGAGCRALSISPGLLKCLHLLSTLEADNLGTVLCWWPNQGPVQALQESSAGDPEEGAIFTTVSFSANTLLSRQTVCTAGGERTQQAYLTFTTDSQGRAGQEYGLGKEARGIGTAIRRDAWQRCGFEERNSERMSKVHRSGKRQERSY